MDGVVKMVIRFPLPCNRGIRSETPSAVRLLLLAALSSTVGVNLVSAQSATTSDLVIQMGDPAESWESRFEIEESLRSHPSTDVLIALFPYVDREPPAPTIWNSRGWLHDREGVPVWQVYYAVRRTWMHHAGRLSDHHAVGLLAGLVAGAGTDHGRIQILGDLLRYWDPQAEMTVAALLSDSDNATVQTAAAKCLLAHTGRKHYRSVIAEARNAPARDRRAWFETLADPAYLSLTHRDGSLFRLGFDLLEARLEEEGVEAALETLGRLSALLNVDFGPLGGGTFQAEVDHDMALNRIWRAMDWWAANRHQFEDTNSGM